MWEDTKDEVSSENERKTVKTGEKKNEIDIQRKLGGKKNYKICVF